MVERRKLSSDERRVIAEEAEKKVELDK